MKSREERRRERDKIKRRVESIKRRGKEAALKPVVCRDGVERRCLLKLFVCVCVDEGRDRDRQRQTETDRFKTD